MKKFLQTTLTALLISTTVFSKKKIASKKIFYSKYDPGHAVEVRPAAKKEGDPVHGEV